MPLGPNPDRSVSGDFAPGSNTGLIIINTLDAHHWGQPGTMAVMISAKLGSLTPGAQTTVAYALDRFDSSVQKHRFVATRSANGLTVQLGYSIRNEFSSNYTTGLSASLAWNGPDAVYSWGQHSFDFDAPRINTARVSGAVACGSVPSGVTMNTSGCAFGAAERIYNESVIVNSSAPSDLRVTYVAAWWNPSNPTAPTEAEFADRFRLYTCPPVANAGPDQTVESESVVQLDGSGSTTTTGTITYQWTQISGQTVTIQNSTSATPSFTAPFESGTLVFELVVNNGGSQSSDQVIVTVLPPPISFVNKWDSTTRTATAFAGSDLESGYLDGPALTARFEELQEIAYGWDTVQRKGLNLGNRFYTVDKDKIRMIHLCEDIIVPGSDYWIFAEGSWGGYYDGDSNWYADNVITKHGSATLVNTVDTPVPQLNTSTLWEFHTPTAVLGEEWVAVSVEERFFDAGDVVQLQGNLYRTGSQSDFRLILYYSDYLNLERMDWNIYWIDSIGFDTFTSDAPTNTWIWSGNMLRIPYTGNYRFVVEDLSSSTHTYYLDRNYYLGKDGINTLYQSDFNDPGSVDDFTPWTSAYPGTTTSAEIKDGRMALKVSRSGTSAAAVRLHIDTDPGSIMYIEYDYWSDGTPSYTSSIGFNEDNWGISSASSFSATTPGWHTAWRGRQTHTVDPWTGTTNNLYLGFPSGVGAGWISNVRFLTAAPMANSGQALPFPF